MQLFVHVAVFTSVCFTVLWYVHLCLYAEATYLSSSRDFKLVPKTRCVGDIWSAEFKGQRIDPQTRVDSSTLHA